ncbi:MAG: hypothetical protein ACK4WD_01165 [Flavobacteriales bacterium]
MNLRATAIFILTTLVVSLFSVVGLLHLQKRQIRKEIKTKLLAATSNDELVHLFIPKNQIQSLLIWEHDHEFEYQGEMYDVVETIEHQDVVEYVCWWDHEETGINKKLQTLVALYKGKHPTEKEKEARVLRFFKAFFFEPTISKKELSKSVIPTTHWADEDFLYFLQKPPCAPPELALI